MFVIERYWFDTLENRNADGWYTIGIVIDEDEAKRIIKLKEYEVAENKWPLSYAAKKGETHVPAFRYKNISNLVGKSLEDLERI